MRLVSLIVYSIAVFTLSIPKLLLVKLTTGHDLPRQRRIAHKFLKNRGMHFLWFAGASCQAEGIENIPTDRPVLFVSNHSSQFDIPLLIKYVDFPVGFIAKKELASIPLLQHWMTLQGSLFLDRKHPRKALATILEGIELMKGGHSMVIFPQGTRSPEGEFLKFKQGSLKLAEKSGALIVPVTVFGTSKLFEDNHAWKLTPAPVRVTYHPPLDPAGWSDEEKRHSAAIVQGIIEEELARLANL